MLNRLLVLVLFLAACGSSRDAEPSRAQELAAYRSSDYYLYYRDRADVVRAACDRSRQVYDHATCNTEITRVPATLLYRRLDQRFTPAVAVQEQRVADLHARIAQVDLRLLEQLATSPHQPDPTLEPAMHAAERSLGLAAAKVQEIKDQVARLEERTRGDTTSDSYRQLVTLRQELTKEIEIWDQRQVAVTEARQAYIDANSQLLDPAVHQALSAQYRDLVARLETAEGQLAQEIRVVAGLARTLSMIEDGGPSWVREHSSPCALYSCAVLDELYKIFDEVDLELRTFTKVAPLGTTEMTLNVNRSERVHVFQCKFQQETSSSCHRVEVTTPQGRKAYVDNWFDHYGGSTRMPAEIFQVDAKGEWRFRITWDCSGQPAPVINEPMCRLVVKSPTD